MTTEPRKIRTRIAPSPTGLLHIGTARSALFNFLFARHHGGAFILRIEDTDLERSSKEFEKNILEGLQWLGMDWDEGPLVGEDGYKGHYGPYRQSERLTSYEEYLVRLLGEGRAFYCSHSQEYLESERKTQMARKENPAHVCEDRDKNLPGGIIRLRNETRGSVRFADSIRGEIAFEANTLGDFSLAKNTRAPLYNFAVVVDDYTMDITHVIRGEDHIPNTPKQILIQEALAFPTPAYAHLPLVLGADKSKLSKRHGAASVDEYRQAGYLPEALINFMALLGWHPPGDRELFTLEELTKEFSLERVQKSGAVFDIEKLNWLNGEYIRQMAPSDLVQKLQPFLADYRLPRGSGERQGLLESIARIEQPRLRRLDEIKDRVEFFFTQPSYAPDLLRWNGRQELTAVGENIKIVYEILCDIEPGTFTLEYLRGVLMPIADERGRGEVLWPLRVALSGREASPDPFEIMSALGKEKTLGRIMHALDLLGVALG